MGENFREHKDMTRAIECRKRKIEGKGDGKIITTAAIIKENGERRGQEEQVYGGDE